MNATNDPSPVDPAGPPRKDESGVALIITLAMLVLVSAIVLAFFSSVTTDLNASKNYEASTNTRVLADSAVNLVIGQIREASTQSETAWVSQPGLIRTYGDDGAPGFAYKLYSAGEMTVSANTFNPVDNQLTGGTDSLDRDLPGDEAWRAQPSLWTDLNAPIVDPSRVGKNADGVSILMKTYPIIDGNHIRSVPNPDKSRGGQVGQMSLDIMYPNGTDILDGPDIQGFQVSKIGTGISTISSFDEEHPIEMPVRWLYMLKDGTIVPATNLTEVEGKTGAALVIPGDKKTTSQDQANVPIARLAFWTDDDSTKVNINTASQGTFWDTPVCNSQATKPLQKVQADNDAIYEMNMAQFLPDQKEYQRYPGHPATTSLSPIFGKQLMRKIPTSALARAVYRPLWIEQLFQMTPRIAGQNYRPGTNGTTTPYRTADDFSSKGGTRRGGNTGQLAKEDTGYPIVTDSDRLYASPDEALFSTLLDTTSSTIPQRQHQAFMQVMESADKASEHDRPREILEMSKFFLTAQSKAPEQNLFGKPRVAVWPVDSETRKRTTFDNVIRFCSTVGQRLPSSDAGTYIFSRHDPDKPDADLTTRNLAIYDYLDKLMGTPLPGYKVASSKKTFKAKYPQNESEQILAEIYDYIRCINLIDRSEDPLFFGGQGDNATTKAFTPPYDDPPNSQMTKRGQVVPTEFPNGARGLGRINTISELALVLVRLPEEALGDVAMQRGPGNPADIPIEAVLLPNFFSPMAGFSSMANNITVAFKKIDIKISTGTTSSGPNQDVCYFPFNPTTNRQSFPLSVTTKAYPSGNTASQFMMFDVGRMSNGSNFESKIGGMMGYKSFLEPAFPTVPRNPGAPAISLPPIGHFMMRPPATNRVYISGSVEVEIYAPTPQWTDHSKGPNIAGLTPIQTFTFVFPKDPNGLPYSAPLPVPQTWGGGEPVQYRDHQQWFASATERNGAEVPINQIQKRGRLIGFQPNDPTGTPNGARGWPAIANGDMVRSLVPINNAIQADTRIIAGKKTIDASIFGATPLYKDATIRQIHSMRSVGGGDSGYNGNFGNERGDGPNAHTTIKPGRFDPVLTTCWVSEYTGGTHEGYYTHGQAKQNLQPSIPDGINGVKNSLNQPGDWDNGPHFILDGPLCNKVDEGARVHESMGRGEADNQYDDESGQFVAPYIGSQYEVQDVATEQAAYFSPNRQIASPVRLGSLPTGVARSKPWQTLLFRPAKSYLPGGITHPGSAAAGPPDHLLLDLFWMPVVEPYPISEPFATAGKINLNSQIVPFVNIKRDTGLRAVFDAVKLTALSPTQLDARGDQFIYMYKQGGHVGDTTPYSQGGGGQGVVVRRNIDIENTLRMINGRLDQNKPFISASEICDVPILPAKMTSLSANLNGGNQATTDATVINTSDALKTFDTALGAFWGSHKLTGDNSLERPYDYLYPRLTTRSNTYTVHVRVQSIQQAKNAPDKAQFIDGRDTVSGEFRGSFIIERYLDPDNAGFYVKDKATGVMRKTTDENDPAAMLGPYCFRVISSKQFTP